MPRGHGRASVYAEKVADRQICALSRRPYLQRSRFPSKENLMVVPVMGNCEQRCVLTFLTLDINLWKLLAPFPLFIQGSELTQPRDQLHSANLNNAETLDGHNPFYPQPTIFIKFDSQKAQDISSPVNSLSTSGSAEMATGCRSSASNVLGPPHRLKQKKSVRNTLSNSVATSVAPKDSSMLYDGSDIVASDVSAGTTTRVDKSAKQSSKKKGKKKRKQHKRSMHKKASAKPENICTEANCDASASETSASVDLACSVASECNLPLIVQTFPVQVASDVDGDKLNMECNAENFSVRSSTLVTETLIASSSTQSYEISLYNSHSKNPEIHMAEESPDDSENQSTVTKDGGFNSLAGETILNSRNDSVQGKHKEQSQQDSDISNSCLDNCSYWQNNVAETDCGTERDLCNIQASSSDDFQPVIRAKRVRLARKFPGTSNGVHRLSNAQLQGCSEKDYRHSIWQKVEKASTAELITSRNSNKFSTRPVDVSSSSMEMSIRPKNPSLLKPNWSGKSFRYSSFNEIIAPQSADSSIPSPMLNNNSSYCSPSDIDGSSTYSLPEKLKRKPNLDTERETPNLIHTSKKTIHRPSRIQSQGKEGLGTAIEFRNISHLNDRIECSTRTTQISNSNTLPATTLDKICSIANSTSSNSQEILTNSSMIESTSGIIHAGAQSRINIESQKMNNDPCICTDKEDDQCTNLEIESAHLESRGANSFPGPMLQKWVPVGSKDSVTNRRQIDSTVNSILHDCIPSSLNSNFTDELLTSNSQQCFSLSTSSSPSSGYLDCSSPEEDEVTSKLVCRPCTSIEESSGISCPSGCQSSHVVKDGMFPSFETDLEKIIDASSASYKLLVAAEGVQLATGSPLAEFERLLQSASPVLEIGCITSCKTCPTDQIIADSLCFHQVPNISLRRLWQWYEKPGNYGLEVKVEDLYATKRPLSGISEFRAYFVPYLSAVQLFARSRSVSCPINHDGDEMKTCKVCNTSKLSTCPDSLPIFSKFVPQPCKGSDTWSTELSLSSKLGHFNKPICGDQLADEELLFEYFDSDQPQQRRPLFDKIEELIQGDSSSNCNFYGDPLKLECINLNELHPASWYAVAWYPIYRIPDGSFRAAFLTYHSFGKFVCRSNSNSAAGCFNSLISPVVGLQNYNAKGECWFEPSNLYSRAVQTEATFSKSPEIFRCRLQSLEETAYVMSRATVCKGNVQYTNRHPDYEFFLSRRR